MKMQLETAGALVCAVIAALVYLNTLPANFAFDDSFAVVSRVHCYAISMKIASSRTAHAMQLRMLDGGWKLDRRVRW